MGFRYRKTKSVAPGVKVNLNKKSASVRFGGRGAGVTLNTNGKKLNPSAFPIQACHIQKVLAVANLMIRVVSVA
ncbi:MAG: DUF4236 domain-containing protein [Lachnospiraceae bacterium]